MPSASTLSSTYCAVVPLVEGRLYALTLPYDLARGTSTHPAGTRGYSSLNCYLLKEGSRALLVDTGFPAQRDALFKLLDELLEPSTRLSVTALRAGEVDSLGNVVPLASRFDLESLYCLLPFQFVWNFDVRSNASRASDRPDARVPASVLLGGSEPKRFPLGEHDTRRLEWFKPWLQLLVQNWLYDEDTRTLFTSEVFGHACREHPTGPWVIDDVAQDSTSVAGLASFLRRSNRFWWLAGSDGRRIADWLDGVFQARAVERIAPAFGCIFEGYEVVQHQIDLLRQALISLSAEPSYAVREAG